MRLYTRETSRSLNERRPTPPKKPRASPLLRTSNITDAPKRPKNVQPLSEQRHLLQPYDLSQQLIALCKQGDVDVAVNWLQRSPKNAQNVKVWNTLIQQCLVAKKYKLAFCVFIDVRLPTYHSSEQLTYLRSR